MREKPLVCGGVTLFHEDCKPRIGMQNQRPLLLNQSFITGHMDTRPFRGVLALHQDSANLFLGYSAMLCAGV